MDAVGRFAVSGSPLETCHRSVLTLKGAALLDRHYLGLADTQHTLGMDGLFDSLLAYESYPIDTKRLQQQASSIDGMAITVCRASSATTGCRCW
jgi:hypothetical protein